MARETVIFDTPSSRAMSASVTGIVFNQRLKLPRASYIHNRFCATKEYDLIWSPPAIVSYDATGDERSRLPSKRIVDGDAMRCDTVRQLPVTEKRIGAGDEQQAVSGCFHSSLHVGPWHAVQQRSKDGEHR
jgi:hypothetical protein